MQFSIYIIHTYSSRWIWIDLQRPQKWKHKAITNSIINVCWHSLQILWNLVSYQLLIQKYENLCPDYHIFCGLC